MNIKDIQINTFSDNIGELKVTYKRTSLPLKFIKSSADVIEHVRPLFDEVMDDKEVVKVVYCNQALGVVYVYTASSGSVSASIVPIKEILKRAIILKSAAIFLIHNHPSSSLKASKADINITEKLKQASKFFDINLMDSLIITRESFYSFADNGKL